MRSILWIRKIAVLISAYSTSEKRKRKIGIFVQNSDEEIESLFSKLEKEIDIVSAQLGAYPNVCSYNARETSKIKERVLVLFDFPFSLHNEDIVQLSIICKNAQRCGFYIILASPYSMGGSNSRSKDGLWGFCSRMDYYRPGF